jgi:hypothetical protein
MGWAVSVAVMALLTTIAWAAWEAVRAFRHLTVQQAATVRLLGKLEERLGTPEEYGAATWSEMERMQIRNGAADAQRWAMAAPDRP